MSTWKTEGHEMADLLAMASNVPFSKRLRFWEGVEKQTVEDLGFLPSYPDLVWTLTLDRLRAGIAFAEITEADDYGTMLGRLVSRVREEEKDPA